MTIIVVTQINCFFFQYTKLKSSSNIKQFLGNNNQSKQNTIKETRINKLSLKKDANSKICTPTFEILQIKNAAIVHQFANLFSLLDLCKTTLRFIERCFTIVSDNESFKQLDYDLIKKILASSNLLTTSEIEVFNVAETWLNYNIKERCKCAKDILLKVRLHLLSKDTIRQLLDGSKFFKKDNDCIKILNEYLNCKNIYFLNTSSVYQKSRYCNQNSFRILVCGGTYAGSKRSCKSVYCVDVNNLEDVEAYPPMIMKHNFPKVVNVKSDLYVFGCYKADSKWFISAEKYTHASKMWSQVAEMHDNRIAFSVCAFMHKVFIFGGDIGGSIINSCLEFDTRDYSWKDVSGMNNARWVAACAVFKDKIVVSGGSDNNYNTLNTVES